jgi:tRNA/tmRNA/rRNA uracil-C5-methylase (TrmA/RlmC/RlmD family)
VTADRSRLVGPVDVGPIAHGGHCVARHDGRVIFVRHALPGERVLLTVTDDSQDRFWRADAVEILAASPDRIEPRCTISGPGRCGGCDFQHVDPAAQRRLKQQVVAEQLQRLAGITWDGEVEEVTRAEYDFDGLGWRTRMRYQVDDQGRAGLRAHRSHEVIALPAEGCPIADPRTPAVTGRDWPPGVELIAAVTSTGQTALFEARTARNQPPLTEDAAGREWRVAADGFWQVHPAAAQTLVDAVINGLDPRPAERAFDLYCGVGLFAGALAGAGCQVWGIESSRQATRDARHNLDDVAGRIRLTTDRVDRVIARLPRRVDLVVLDPPRSGAGRAVIGQLTSRRPRAIAYVACDPAALARDLGTARDHGYQLVSIRAFDLFPMTHHIECVAILIPATASEVTLP